MMGGFHDRARRCQRARLQRALQQLDVPFRLSDRHSMGLYARGIECQGE